MVNKQRMCRIGRIFAQIDMMLKMSIQRRHFTFRLLAVLGTLGGALPALAKSGLPVLLAHNAPKGMDPAGYLVSEKLDGVRALWDGNVLRFRSGRTIAAPAWFTSKLPATPMDGELWLARGQFDVLSGTVRKAQPIDAEWQQVKYMVFELPQGSGSFAQRAAQLQSVVQAAAWPALQAVEQYAVASPAALQAKLKSTTSAGGEGLMLHLANAPVTAGRSDVLLKLKPAQDAEATVVGHVAGKGKYAGMVGALEVKAANGQRFRLGTGLSDADRQNPPAVGSVVTYTYRDTTPSGKPRFASFLRAYEGE
jgi:DNA ligase 1